MHEHRDGPINNLDPSLENTCYGTIDSRVDAIKQTSCALHSASHILQELEPALSDRQSSVLTLDVPAIFMCAASANAGPLLSQTWP